MFDSKAKMPWPALILLAAVAGVVPARADPAEELRAAAVREIGSAGSAAGLSRACGVDPAPITAAIHELLHRIPLDGGAESAALGTYRANETRMTANLTAIPGARPCEDLDSVMQQTVRGLNAIGAPQSAARDDDPPGDDRDDE